MRNIKDTSEWSVKNNHDVKLKLLLTEGRLGTNKGAILVTHISLGPKRDLKVKT